jgi:hypothetical protein
VCTTNSFLIGTLPVSPLPLCPQLPDLAALFSLVSTGCGGYVRRYGELIEYLLRKDPSIKALEMDFEGKNILLYSLGGLVPLRDPAERVPHICKGPATSEHWWRLSRSDQQQTQQSDSNGKGKGKGKSQRAQWKCCGDCGSSGGQGIAVRGRGGGSKKKGEATTVIRGAEGKQEGAERKRVEKREQQKEKQQQEEEEEEEELLEGFSDLLSLSLPMEEK